MSWNQAGYTGVDAGVVLITDPCYVVRDPGDHEEAPFRSYRDHLLPELRRQEREAGQLTPLPSYQLTNEHGALVGVIVGRFGGDGVYPVYIEHDGDGIVVAAMIRFDESDPRSAVDEQVRWPLDGEGS